MTAAYPSDLIKAETALVASGMTLQAQSMALLLAEMQALSDLFANPALGRAGCCASADLQRQEAVAEAGFDNMPV